MSIENLSEQQCIKAIEEGGNFHAEVADGAFTIKIESKAPFICLDHSIWIHARSV